MSRVRPALFVLLLFSMGCPKPVEEPLPPPIPEMDFTETAWKITRIEAARPLNPDPFQPFLESRESIVRARAAVAVGRSGEAHGGEAAAPFVEKLKESLADGEPRVRRSALFGLGLIGPPAGGLLADHLEREEDPQARRIAVRAMGRVVPTEVDAAKTAPELAALVDRLGDPEESGVAAIALGVYAVRAKRSGVAVPYMTGAGVLALQQQFRARPGPQRWPYAYALYRLGRAEAARDFVIGLGDPDPSVRAVCAKGLGTIQGVVLLYDGLEEALDDPDAGVRIEAARALGKRGVSGRKAIPDLLDLIDRGKRSRDPRERHVAVAAADALAELGERAASEAIEKRLRGTRAFLFPSLVRAYVSTTGDAAVAELKLLVDRADTGEPPPADSSEDFSWMRRQSIAMALAAVAPKPDPTPPDEAEKAEKDEKDEKDRKDSAAEDDPKDPPATPTAAIELAKTLATDEDGRVRWAAWDSYATLVGEDAAPEMIEALQDPDAAVVGTAADKLAGWKHAGAADALAKRLQAALTDDPEVTVTLVHAVGALERKQDEDLLREIAGSDNRAAALAALSVLRTAKAELPHTPHGRTPQRLPALPEFGATGDLLRAVVKTTKGDITLHLLPREAPLTVLNFARLARRGDYRDIVIHRVVPGFVAQDGCPRGDGWGGPGYGIPCELTDRRYERGMVGMALAGRDTGGSQWFIALTPQPHLEANYTIFARVVRGMDVADRLERGDRVLDIQVR